MVISGIRTESSLLVLYGNMQVSEDPYSKFPHSKTYIKIYSCNYNKIVIQQSLLRQSIFSNCLKTMSTLTLNAKK